MSEEIEAKQPKKRSAKPKKEKRVRTPSQKGRASRRKGQVYERDLVHRFRAVMPDAEIKRGLQSRGGGAEIPDVDMPVFHVEAKNMKLCNPRAALRQALAEAVPGKTPLAICKDFGGFEFVAMTLEDFLAFVKEWWARR
jgi:hypothetical protein